MFFFILPLVTCFKLLLIPAYRSTDFEVHRNWLAITHNLPIKKWYFENTSEWTLDYPPIFAWFEYFLSQVAQYFDKDMLVIENLNYSSWETIVFQRLSVIIADLVYAYGVQQCCLILPKSWQTNVILPVLLLANVGLLMVDHIHFQYNGIMFGILLLSITKMLKEQYIWSAFWFTILLNMKHIFIYLAPAYFIYMLRNYCFRNKKAGTSFSTGCIHFIKLAGTVISLFLITFVPFYDHINQVFLECFHVERKITDIYYISFFCAYNNMCKKITALLLKRVGVLVKTCLVRKGDVAEGSYTTNPSPGSLVNLIETIVSSLSGEMYLWQRKLQDIVVLIILMYLACVWLCPTGRALFGVPVHTKAWFYCRLFLTVSFKYAIISHAVHLISSLISSIQTFFSSAGPPSIRPYKFTQNFVKLKLIIQIFWFNFLLRDTKDVSVNKHKIKIYETRILLSIFFVFIYCICISVNSCDRLVLLPFANLSIITFFCIFRVLPFFFLKTEITSYLMDVSVLLA
ncbi:dolichyl glycosyltransferase [Holotrichia oblita]|uniref:Dolichyl glycosyltransferase n=1 Tax=Holotrichia oblita TaxID=644536 RepID=A0ACB9SYU5_HOLOL|nr:dolichyl glycosyltransferase [Holotrichia oblita]